MPGFFVCNGTLTCHSKEKKKTMINQDILRKQTKIAKALNEDFTYKAFAEALNITDHSFYNWLKGYYNLSHAKAEYLQSIVIEWQE